MIKRDAIFRNGVSFPINHEDQEWDFHNENTQQHLHSLHPYPARFIPQIPRKAITMWTSPGDMVLDPFCGCGTTLLESILLGRPAIGVDNNPVAILATNAKTTWYTKDDLNVLVGLARDLDRRLAAINQPPTPNYPNRSYWFSEEAIEDLGRLKAIINLLPENPRLLAMTVFSSIIVRASNQDSDTRYARIKRTYHKGSAINRFKEKINDANERLQQIIDLPKNRALVYCADSRNLSFIASNSIKLVVTSPPYLNAYDYHKYHRHRMYWIDGNVEFARDTEIGKHDTFTRPKATPEQYFVDMARCFSEWTRVLTPGGYAFIVVGDAIVNGYPVPVGDTLITICSQSGLTFENRWVRNLDTARKSFNQGARIDKEHLLLFRKLSE